MTGFTPSLDLPYPQGTDPVQAGALAMQQLAETLDVAIPSILSPRWLQAASGAYAAAATVPLGSVVIPDSARPFTLHVIVTWTQTAATLGNAALVPDVSGDSRAVLLNAQRFPSANVTLAQHHHLSIPYAAGIEGLTAFSFVGSLAGTAARLLAWTD